MDRVHARRVATTVAVALCSLMGTASASAATTNPFGCRASLARVGLGGTTVAEPVVANKASSPCATETSGLNSASIPSVSGVIALAGPAGVFTYSSNSQPTTTGPVAPGASALASVDGVTVPTSSGSIVIAGPVQASASYACVNGSVQAKSNSTLDVLYINGNRVTLTPNENQTIQLGGGSYVSVNEKIQTSTSITERVLDVHLQGLADIVVGEAKVTQDQADPCAGSGAAIPPAVQPCPSGSTYDPVSGYCVITQGGGSGGGGGGGGGVIIISRPYQGPTGGSVLALSVARRRFTSKCLAGPGPAYVIVGTNHADHINGTHRPERILGLSGIDRIAGQGGNDCLDGGAGKDRLWGGNGNNRDFGGPGNDRISVQNGNAYVDGGSGNDRIFLGNGNDTVYGGSGNDRISVGRGRDHVYGGAGNDDISTGNGNDWVWGGAGNDRIWVGTGKDHVFGGGGKDRIYAPGEQDYVTCGGGSNVAFVNVFAAPFARRHGCRVRMVRPHTLK